MDKAYQVVNIERLEIKKGFEVHIKVLKVPKRSKFPDGIKLRCVLINTELNVPILLLDNHEPFGYHMHTRLPYDKNHRVKVIVNSYEEAVSFFLNEARKVANNEI